MAYKFIAFCFLLSCLTSAPIQAPKPPQLHLRTTAEQATTSVAIEVMCFSHGKTEAAYGSGVILDSTHVLTARHVIFCAGFSYITLTTFNDKHIHTWVTATDGVRDLAMLVPYYSTENILDVKFPVIAKPDLTTQRVCAYPSFPLPIRTCGDIKYLDPAGEFNIIYTALTTYGNSGSGLWNERGELIGVVTGMLHDADKMYGEVGLAAMIWDKSDLLKY